MLELDKSGNWWLDGSIIEPWEITEKWTEMVNACEAMADNNEKKDAELAALTIIKDGHVERCVELMQRLRVAEGLLGDCQVRLVQLLVRIEVESFPENPSRLEIEELYGKIQDFLPDNWDRLKAAMGKGEKLQWGWR